MSLILDLEKRHDHDVTDINPNKYKNKNTWIVYPVCHDVATSWVAAKLGIFTNIFSDTITGGDYYL